jgi:type VI secretion system protein ImpL
MGKIILITAPITLAYLILAWFTGNLLGIQGKNLWILRIVLSLIGIAAAAVVVWFLANKKKEEERAAAGAEEAQEGGEEIAVLIREAEKKLSAAQLEKGARIGNLPAILLLGEAASAKTSTVLNSALEPELLAGQALKDGNVTPTRSANLWYSRRTLLVEASGKLMEDATGRAILLKRLQPRKAVVGKAGQAPRAALVCLEIDRLTGGGQAMTATALSLRTRLGEIAQSFGIHLPVYVLFTKADRLPFFADFVRNLSNEEGTQALGVTLPIVGLTSGVYAEERTAQLGGYLDQLFRSLCDARPEFLAREKDATKLPATYEFPREFRKLRGPLVQFLVDLCRPSQLTVGPFLRGFYFSGVRPVTIQETAPAPERSAPAMQSSQGARDATEMFRVPSGGPAAAAAPQRRVAVTRRVPQWLFLSHLFNEVLLADRVAMGASGSSAKTDLVRRILLTSAAVVCLIFCIGFTISFFLNRDLEKQIEVAASGTSVAPVGTNLASLESLRRLENLRRSLQTLTEYNRDGAPLSYRWGLYIGNDLYTSVRPLYFRRFRQLLLAQTQNTLVTSLGGLPAAPGPTSPSYDQTYEKLKAYLITTSNHDKSTREFLSPVLLKTWSANVDPERKQLAQAQFDFYSDELQRGNPFSEQNDKGAVTTGRRYLNQFAEFERIYQNMKAGAPKTVINFNRQVPGSKDYVVDGYDVAGPFTKEGWSFMSDAVKNPNRYIHGDEWVLGPQGPSSDHSKLIEDLRARYEKDFISQWRAYLKSASVVKYKDAKDAADKLDALSGNASALLALLDLASKNTEVDDPTVVKALQPARFVVPPNSDRLIGPQNQNYITALSTLQASVVAVVKSADGNDSGAANKAFADAATAARQTVKQLSSVNFNPDLEAHIDTTVSNLLEAPITDAEEAIRGQGPAELNAKGKDLCGKYSAVLHKYPFNPAGATDATVDDFNKVFNKPDGLLWTFYEANLKKYLTKQDNQYVAVPTAGMTINKQFIDFFNQAAQFSESVYAGGSKDPHFAYTMKWVPTEGVQGAGLQIDGQTQSYSAGADSAKPFAWQGSGTHAATATVNLGGTDLTLTTSEGLWAVFRFFGKADRREPTQTGDRLDWVMRSGNSKEAVTLKNGKPVTAEFELNMASGSPSVFRKDFFSHMACVADVAKQQ